MSFEFIAFMNSTVRFSPITNLSNQWIVVIVDIFILIYIKLHIFLFIYIFILKHSLIEYVRYYIETELL